MAGFRFTRAAERDLQEINDYLERDSTEVALHVLRRIEHALDELVEMPETGHRREDLTDEPFRFWSVFDYLIVYDPDTSPLVIVRVLHGRRDVRGELDTY